MKYLRFLKIPRYEGTSITALLTISSDLGDTIFTEDVQIDAILWSVEAAGTITKYQQKQLRWQAGARTLQVAFKVPPKGVKGPLRLQVKTSGSDCIADEATDLPSIVQAWSAAVDRGQETEKMVQRRLRLSDSLLSIWEETGESIARHIWDAGMALTAYLDRIVTTETDHLPLLSRTLRRGRSAQLNVLELGCGCGLVGIGLAHTLKGCKIVLTDLPEVEDLVRRNVQANLSRMKSSEVSFAALDWQLPLPQSLTEDCFDVILVSDCVYNPDSADALVSTVASIVRLCPRVVVIVAMKNRHPSEAVFFDRMEEAGLLTAGMVSLPLPVGETEAEENIDIHVFHGAEADPSDVQQGKR